MLFSWQLFLWLKRAILCRCVSKNKCKTSTLVFTLLTSKRKLWSSKILLPMISLCQSLDYFGILRAIERLKTNQIFFFHTNAFAYHTNYRPCSGLNSRWWQLPDWLRISWHFPWCWPVLSLSAVRCRGANKVVLFSGRLDITSDIFAEGLLNSGFAWNKTSSILKVGSNRMLLPSALILDSCMILEETSLNSIMSS